MLCYLAILVAGLLGQAQYAQLLACNVHVRLQSGRVCGLTRWAEAGTMYASFRGVPYAKQPVGELRFKELQPVEHWDNIYDASTEGPICPQTDILYGKIMQPQRMSEACIHANIHVPLEALPGSGLVRISRELEPPYQTGVNGREEEKPGLPILVFIHGGGFAFGSGDADLHGPEYLVTKKNIVITFNYRLNVFGFLSLNSSAIPGNNGLRDMVTLLRWVQENAKAFGGDPDNVTLAGQSAGAVSAHLLSLSNATKGLFKRVMLLSGTGATSFVSTSPVFAQYIANMLLTTLGINETDPDVIHQKLIDMPLEKLIDANSLLIDEIGLSTFLPVVETPFSGVTTILDDNPDTLISKGRGKDIPLIIGFTNVECEIFRPRFEKIDMVKRIKENPILLVPFNLIYSSLPNSLIGIAKKVEQRYFNGTINLDNYIKYCSASYFEYPAIKLAETRAKMGAASVFLYEFAYNSDHSVLKESHGLKYNGATHIEDLTYIFRVNSLLGTHSSFPPMNKDDEMKDSMTTIVSNFMRCSDPLCGETAMWSPVTKNKLTYEEIEEPMLHNSRELTQDLQDTKVFFDVLHDTNSSLISVK